MGSKPMTCSHGGGGDLGGSSGFEVGFAVGVMSPELFGGSCSVASNVGGRRFDVEDGKGKAGGGSFDSGRSRLA